MLLLILLFKKPWFKSVHFSIKHFIMKTYIGGSSFGSLVVLVGPCNLAWYWEITFWYCTLLCLPGTLPNMINVIYWKKPLKWDCTVGSCSDARLAFSLAYFLAVVMENHEVFGYWFSYISCSIDEFFECFDGMRSYQAISGSSGIWNWTCSVFSAISVASNLASGSGHVPKGNILIIMGMRLVNFLQICCFNLLF